MVWRFPRLRLGKPSSAVMRYLSRPARDLNKTNGSEVTSSIRPIVRIVSISAALGSLFRCGTDSSKF